MWLTEFGLDFGSASIITSPAGGRLEIMASTREHPQVIRDYLATKCSEGRVLGPLDPSHFPMVASSRFGVIPKGSTGKWRLIVDLSSPEGASVNDGINEALCSLSYIGVDDATKEVLRQGQGALLAKVDV